MKEGWEYKKLGEITTQISDGSHNPPKGIEYSNYPMLSSKNIFFDKFNYDSPRYLSKEDFEAENKRTNISDGDVLLTIVGTVGRTCCVQTPFTPFTLQRSVAVLKPQKDIVKARFLMYFLHSLSDFWEIEAKGVAQKGVYLKQVGKIPIPVPPLSEQQQIVEELDLLNGIIEKKKAQLKELDHLAQSLFYEMFGDPITNEKGWEVKKLKDVSTLLNGRAYKQNELLSEGKYKVLRVGNFFTNSSYYYSDLELEDNKYCDNGDLLFAWSASFGAFIWHGKKVIYHYHIWKVLFDEKVLNKIYYQYLLNTMTKSFMNDVHGIGMVHLTKVGMEQYMLPVPPLALQQQFASKIEAIEKQKELIKQSITEVETLFNSRMDYYFN